MARGQAGARNAPIGFESQHQLAWMDDRYKLVRVEDVGRGSWDELYRIYLDSLDDGPDLIAQGLLDADAQAAYDTLAAELDALEADLVYDH